MTSPSEGDTSRRRPVAVPIAGLVMVAGLGITAMLGGFGEAPAEVRQLGKGATLDQHQFRTRFVDAVVRSGAPGIGVPDRRYLEILMKVTNQSDRTLSVQTLDRALPEVRTDTGTVLKDPGDRADFDNRLVIPGEGKSYTQIHPRQTQDVILSIEYAAGKKVPAKVRIDAGDYEWHEDFFYQTHYWQPKQDLAAQVTLDVREEAGP